jgi:hypothetical protein
LSPGDFSRTLQFFIDNEKKPYSEITLKGKGQFPRLTFDRREVILPITPVGIESKCVFRIINDGYENLTLDHIMTVDHNIIPLKLNFPDGKNIGVTKNRIKVEAVFLSNKPLSFTTEVQFKDDHNRFYPIKISGTSDNSILTTFPYI